MLRIISLLLVFIVPQCINAQPGMNNYKELWKKIEEAENKGLTQTANELAIKIYQQAEKDRNHPQVIKAAVYRIKYRNMVEEESEKTNHFFLDTLIGTSKAPARNILRSMQAEQLWQFLQNNRWRYYNRTQLVEEKTNDILTWSIAKFHQTISALYLESLNEAAVLKQTKTELYDAVIEKGENTRHLRPTVYDLLANRALDYFKNDERDIAKPAYAFKLAQPEAFAPVNEFIAFAFKTKDTTSVHHKALLIYQELLAFHKNDAQPDALIDADIDRLEFVHQHSTLADKEKKYETALKAIEDKYSASPASAQAGYLRASLYNNRAQGYDPLTRTDNQYEYKRAKELCEAIAKKFPKSEGGINSKNLLNGIKRPSLNLETELVNVPEQPFRVLVSYKNIPKLYFRFIKTTHDDLKQLNRRNDGNPWPKIIALKAVKTWETTLPDLGDFQTHHLEIKADALASG
ncbi:MAG: alpha-2-macroglobulin, partial [Dinghuibacter sp.]|nr:alpha-2-macroglobulin [Dinghuibacter sp.]